MRSHIQIVAWLHIVYGAFGVLLALMVGGLIGGIGLFMPDAVSGGIMAAVATFVAGFIALLSVPSLVAGWGLLARKSWARILVIILSVLNLFNVPVGTIVGAYSLWVMMQNETKVLLEGRQYY